MSANLGMNFPSWFTIPLNLCNSVIFCGAGNLEIAFVFSGSALIPSESTICPRNLIDFFENSHLSLRVSPAA